MDLHLHWLTSAILAISELIASLMLRKRLQFPFFRWYLVSVALRACFPYLTYGDTPWLDGAVLLLRSIAVLELVICLIAVVRQSDIAMLALSIACFQVASLIPIQRFIVQSTAKFPDFVTLRQVIHIELLIAVVVSLYWISYKNLNCPRFIVRHGSLLAAYLFLYVAAGFWISLEASRCAALVAFDLTSAALMGLWGFGSFFAARASA